MRPDTPLRLRDAVRLAFPAGGIAVSGLRKERDAGRLAVVKIAGKEFTTLAAITEMKRLCLHQPRGRASTSARPATAARLIGSSLTLDDLKRAQAAASAILQGLKRGSKSI